MAWRYTQIGDVMVGQGSDHSWFEDWKREHGSAFRLEAVSAESGDLLWAIHNADLSGSQALASDGQVIVTSDGKRSVAVCLELRTGRKVWEHRTFPEFDSDGVPEKRPMQPAIWNGLAILNWLQVVEAVDLKTGNRVWCTDNLDFSWHSLGTLVNDRFFAVGDDEYLVLDLRNGDVLLRQNMRREFASWGLKPFYIRGGHLAVAKDFVFFPRAQKLVCMNRFTGEIVAVYRFTPGLSSEPYWLHDRLVIQAGPAMTVFEHNPRGRLTKPRKTLITKGLSL